VRQGKIETKRQNNAIKYSEVRLIEVHQTQTKRLECDLTGEKNESTNHEGRCPNDMGREKKKTTI